MGGGGGVPQTFGSCQEVYGLIRDSGSHDKQQMRPLDGSTGGGFGHGRRHIPEAWGWRLHRKTGVWKNAPVLQAASFSCHTAPS